jgi:hypothetical protein
MIATKMNVAGPIDRQSSLAARENIIARRRTSAAFGKTHIEVALNDPLCVQWN